MNTENQVKPIKKNTFNLFKTKWLKFPDRQKAIERSIVLDEATRNKRQRRALDALEKDNFQDDLSSKSLHISDFRVQLNKKFQQRFTIQDEPHLNATLDSTLNNSGNLSLSSLNESTGETTSKKRKIKADSRLRLKKNFATMLDEEVNKV